MSTQPITSSSLIVSMMSSIPSPHTPPPLDNSSVSLSSSPSKKEKARLASEGDRVEGEEGRTVKKSRIEKSHPPSLQLGENVLFAALSVPFPSSMSSVKGNLLEKDPSSKAAARFFPEGSLTSNEPERVDQEPIKEDRTPINNPLPAPGESNSSATPMVVSAFPVVASRIVTSSLPHSSFLSSSIKLSSRRFVRPAPTFESLKQHKSSPHSPQSTTRFKTRLLIGEGNFSYAEGLILGFEE